MWTQHLKVCIGFLFLIIPIFIADNYLLKPRGGDWISLDFRGLYTFIFLIFLAGHFLISSLAIKFYPSLGIILSHVISIAIIVSGYTAYYFIDDWAAKQKWLAERKPLINVLELNRWQVSPDGIVIDVTTHKSGQFGVRIYGTDKIEGSLNQDFYYSSTDDELLLVHASDKFSYHGVLKRERQGNPTSIIITLSLKDSTGRYIEKTFMPNPKTNDDGTYFYGELPQPSIPQKEGANPF